MRGPAGGQRIAGRRMESLRHAAIVDYPAQFDAEEPVSRDFASSRRPIEHLVSPDTMIMTDGQCGGIDE